MIYMLSSLCGRCVAYQVLREKREIQQVASDLQALSDSLVHQDREVTGIVDGSSLF